MDDLIAFVTARLDEDEAAARAVQDNSDPWPGRWEADGNDALRTYNGWVLAAPGTPGGEFKPGVLAHLARHDPARVLREVEAGRQLLSDYEEARTSEAGTALVIERILFMQLVNRASVWSDHPDYRPEWKP